jgi:hypothetical protein
MLKKLAWALHRLGGMMTRNKGDKGMKKATQYYYSGFKVKLTGNVENLYGDEFYQFFYMEGPQKGQEGWMIKRIKNRQDWNN